MTHELYPQPTTGDLTEGKIYWKGFNSYWWSIMQGKVNELANPSDWQDYTEEIESAIQEMTIPEEPMFSYSALVRRTTDQSIPASTWTAISWSSLAANSIAALWPSPAFTTRLAATRAGWWRVDYQIVWAVSAVGQRLARVRHNGVTVYPGDVRNAVGGSLATYLDGTIPIYLAIGDYVEIQVFHNTAAPLAVLGSVPLHNWARLAYEGSI